MSNIPIFTIIPCNPEFPWLKNSVVLENPPKNEQQHLYFSKGESTPFDWQFINEENACICHKGESCRFALLRHTPFCWHFTLTDWLSDESGNHYDFQINGQIQISDAQTFLAMIPPASDTLSVEMLNTSLQQALTAIVDNALTQLRNDFGDNNLLFGGKAEQSRDWFAGLMQPVFFKFGCKLQKDFTFHWYSREKIAAEEEKTEKKAAEKAQQRLEWERQVELERKRSRAEYEQKIKDIQADATLNNLEREKRIETAKKNLLLELTEKDHQLAAKMRDEALKEAEHEKEIARLKADTEAIKRAEEKREKIEEEWAQEKKRMEILHQAIETRMESIDEQIDRIESSISAKLEEMSRLFQKAEWLYNWGVRAEDLEYAGFDNHCQIFFENLEKQQEADGRVQMYMPELTIPCNAGHTTRDIGCKKRPKKLKVGRELNFKITSELAGYLTVLNLGTSGRLWLNVPNSYIKKAKIEEDQSLAMPGKGTLPWSGLDKAGLEYMEMGPGGWERMAAIVTPQPLIDTTLLYRSYPDQPLVLIERDDLRRIKKKLEQFNQNEWSAAILTFLVEG